MKYTEEKATVIKIIQKLLKRQRLAVLATQNNGQPYTSLVAFSASDDLKYILFSTGRTTRKYSNLKSDSRVSILFDNRTNRETDFHRASAATAIGEAEEVSGSEKGKLIEEYLSKHPHLEEFVKSPTCAFFKVLIEHYYAVSKFQKVMELKIK